jgi:hypothetical protein
MPLRDGKEMSNRVSLLNADGNLIMAPIPFVLKSPRLEPAPPNYPTPLVFHAELRTKVHN